MRVVLVSPRIGAVSEHFVRRHEVYLANDLVAVFTPGSPVPDAPSNVRYGTRPGSLWRLNNRVREHLGLRHGPAMEFHKIIKGLRPEIVLFEFGVTAADLYRPCLDTGTPFVTHFHGYDAHAMFQSRKGPEMLAAARAARVNIANSVFTAEGLRRNAGPVRTVIKYMGVAIPSAQPPLPDQATFGVCHLGRFVPKKNPLYTIKAFEVAKAACSRMQLHMVGDGDMHEECIAYVREHAIPDVHMYGALPHPEAMKVLRSCHVLTQHSMTAPRGDSEGFGVSLAEAMACGRPVVSTLHGPIPEVVDNGRSGLLVPEGDWLAQSEALRRLYADQGLLASMAQASYERAASLFSEAAEKDKLLMILSKCIKGDWAS